MLERTPAYESRVNGPVVLMTERPMLTLRRANEGRTRERVTLDRLYMFAEKAVKKREAGVKGTNE